MLNDLQTQSMQKAAPCKARVVEEAIDHILSRQRLAAIAVEKTKPIASFKHERKDQSKDGKTGQSERLGNAGFAQQLPDL